MDIDKILLKVLNNKANSEEYAALESWKQESEANIKLLQELKENAEKGAGGYKEYDKQAAWHKVETRIIKAEAPAPARSKVLPFIMAAACIGLLITAVYLLSDGLGGEEFPSQHLAEQENLQFALADNSDIWLRSGGSTLDIVSDFATERRVSLKGEAFFEITKDTDKPFIIEVGNSDYVKVVGTSFNLINEGSEFDLTVYSGVVEFHSKSLSNVITLTKGQRATKINGSIVKINNNDQNKLSWKSDELTFDHTDMAVAFRTLSSHYKTEIDFSDSSNDLTDCKVRDRFGKQTLVEVLQRLADSHGLQYTTLADKVIIKNLSCK